MSKDIVWVLWLAAALLAGVAEIATADFVLMMVAAGAVAGAGTALAGGSFPLQAVVFAVVSTLLLVTVRPALKRWVHRSAPFQPTNVDALHGRRAEVISEVTERGGTVKLAGEVWTARAEDPAAVLEPGSAVDVVTIDGATAVVRAVRNGGGLPPGPPAPPATGRA